MRPVQDLVAVEPLVQASPDPDPERHDGREDERGEERIEAAGGEPGDPG